MRPIKRGIPARNCPIFGVKDESACAGYTIFTDNKVGGAVENVAGRSCGCPGWTSCGRRNSHYQRNDRASTLIQSREPRAIVRNPPGAGGAMRKTPGIHQIVVGHLGLPRKV